MRSIISFCRVMVWIVLVLTTFLQTMAIIGIFINKSGDAFNPALLITAAAVMIVSVILFFALPRGKLIPLLTAAADAIFFVILALQMMDAFPVMLATDGSSTGISLWIAIYRHMSPALVPLFMLPVWWQYHEDRQAEKTANAEQNTPSYFDMLDESYAMRSLDDDDAKAPKPKRSVRARTRKSEDNT